MNINKNNYEAFFLDYHEGNLTPAQVAEVICFVEQYPELKEKLESFENFTIEDFSTFEFQNKSSLKKEITVDNKEEYFIKSVENILNTSEIGLLNDFLKRNPEHANELALFRKTKLKVDTSIVFENKNELKKSHSISGEIFSHRKVEQDELLISSMEGLLTKEETILLNQQLVANVQLQQDYTSYQKTKLIADTSFVYDNKEELKRKRNKVIPFYYYAAAASLALLFGLFFLFNNNKINPNLADVKSSGVVVENSSAIEKLDKEKNIKIKNALQLSVFNSSIVKKKKLKNKNVTQQQSTVIAENSIIPLALVNKAENIKSVVIPKDTLFIQPSKVKAEQSTTTASVVAKNEKKKETQKSTEFIPFRELAVEKVKEKLLDRNAFAAQKKAGRLKKITGWDIAQMITSGISKLTGRHVEVKPYYNEEGAVTAYALSAGSFKISKER
jgi:hypothetical protein